MRGDIQQKFKIIKLWLDQGISVFVFEYRGFGASPGHPTAKSMTEDGVSAYNYLIDETSDWTFRSRVRFTMRERVLDETFVADDIAIYGESLGGAIALNTQHDHACRGVFVESTFQSLEFEIRNLVRIKGRKILDWIPSRFFPLTTPNLDNLAIVRDAHSYLVIMHGTLDTTISVEQGRLLADTASCPVLYVELPNSKHSDLGIADADLPLVRSTFQDFIQRLG